MRTHYCGSVSAAELDQTVTLYGWVHRRRDHGGVIFIDLRDREGLVQVVCDPDRAETFAAAERVRSEFVLRVQGVVRRRPEGTANPNIRSGEIEVLAHELEILNAVAHAAVPDGRREHLRDGAPHAPRPRPAPPADAEEPDAALPHRDGGAPVPRRAGLHRHRDADAHQVHARGRARLPGALARARRQVLRAAAVAAAVQAAADDGGLRPLLPDHQVLPRRGPARRPAARVHADRLRDLVPRRDRDPRDHGGHDPHRVQGGARRRAAGPVSGRWPTRGDARLRLRQAGPARAAQAHRAHRRDEDGRVQGVLRRRQMPGGRVAGLLVPGGGGSSRAGRSTTTPSSSKIYGAKGLAYIKVNELAKGREGMQSPDREEPLGRRAGRRSSSAPARRTAT